MKLSTKIIIGVVIIALILGGAYYSIAYWPGEAPTALASVILTNTDTGDQWQADVSIDSGAKALTAFGSKKSLFRPLTTQQVQVPFLDPLAIYNIEWFITIKASPPQGIVDLNGTVSIEGTSFIGVPGWSGDAGYRHNQTQDGTGQNPTGGIPETLTLVRPMIPEVEETFQFPLFQWLTWDDGGGGDKHNIKIKGQWVNGSAFHVIMIVDGGPTSFGATEADIEIIVGPGGEIIIEMTNISASVS